MPTNKDFKRLVRARMQKTGEAYTTARAQLLKLHPAPASISQAAEPIAPPVPIKIEFAKLAGMSDTAVKNATGCNWEKWVWALDRAGADAWTHRAIADYVKEAYKVKDWWAQNVTVGYERIKGLREKGQRRGGSFEANKSKSIAASAATVFKAFTHKRVLKKWLPGTNLTVRHATPNRSVRMNWDDGTSVEVWLTSKGAKTTAAVTHTRLASKDDVETRKAFWAERLSELQQTLEA